MVRCEASLPALEASRTVSPRIDLEKKDSVTGLLLACPTSNMANLNTPARDTSVQSFTCPSPSLTCRLSSPQLDILQRLPRCVRQLESDRADVENAYARAVSVEATRLRRCREAIGAAWADTGACFDGN